MRTMKPLKMLREVNGVTDRTLEQAEWANAAYGRMEEDPAPPDRATGLPVKDATFNNGDGYSATVNPGGPGDTTDFPAGIAHVDGTRSRVDPNAKDFPRLTPNEPDGFEDRGSGVQNIIRRGRG